MTLSQALKGGENDSKGEEEKTSKEVKTVDYAEGTS